MSKYHKQDIETLLRLQLAEAEKQHKTATTMLEIVTQDRNQTRNMYDTVNVENTRLEATIATLTQQLAQVNEIAQWAVRNYDESEREKDELETQLVQAHDLITQLGAQAAVLAKDAMAAKEQLAQAQDAGRVHNEN